MSQKVEKSEALTKQVEDTLKSITATKVQIENDRDSIFTAMLRVQDESASLSYKCDKIKSELESHHTDKIKRIVKLETNSVQQENEISILK